VNNTFGLFFEAGFPLANTTLKGDMEITMKGNVISQSCQNDALITFNRHTTTLGTAQLTRPYIRNSSYRINLGGDLQFANLWYSNPAGLGNELTVDGTVIPAGARLAYDANKVCDA
jgi:hypothetical protein